MSPVERPHLAHVSVHARLAFERAVVRMLEDGEPYGLPYPAPERDDVTGNDVLAALDAEAIRRWVLTSNGFDQDELPELGTLFHVIDQDIDTDRPPRSDEYRELLVAYLDAICTANPDDFDDCVAAHLLDRIEPFVAELTGDDDEDDEGDDTLPHEYDDEDESDDEYDDEDDDGQYDDGPDLTDLRRAVLLGAVVDPPPRLPVWYPRERGRAATGG